MASELPQVGLGVLGLDTAMVHGGIYAVEMKTQLAHCPLYAGCMQSALQGLGKASLLVSKDPEDLYSCMSRYPQLDLAGNLEHGHLQIFVMQPEFQKNMFRFGVDSFVNELNQFDLPENSFLIIDEAQNFLTLDVAALAQEQLMTLSKWMKQKSVTCLLGFSSINEHQSAVLTMLKDHLSGKAAIGRVRGHLELTFGHWQSADEQLDAETYRLAITADEFLDVVHKDAEQEEFAPFTAPLDHALRREHEDVHSAAEPLQFAQWVASESNQVTKTAAGADSLRDVRAPVELASTEEVNTVLTPEVRPFHKFMYAGSAPLAHAGRAAVPKARRAVAAR